MGEFTQINAQSAAGPAAPLVERTDPNAGKGLVQAGDAIQKVGIQIQAAQKRTDDRNDTVHRSRAFDEFQGVIATEQSRLETEGDFTDPEMRKQFGIFLKENHSRLIEDHRGVATSDDSVQRLSARLGSLQALAARQMGASVTKAGREHIRTGLTDKLSKIGVDAGATGDVASARAAVDEEIEEAKGSLNPAEEKAFKDTGYGFAYSEIYETRMGSSDIEGAKAVLSLPDAVQSLGFEKHRKFTNAIIKAERAAEKGRLKGEQKLEELSVISGIPVADFSDDQRLMMANLKPPVGRVTLATKVSDFTAVMKAGNPDFVINQDQIDKLAGTFITDTEKVFGGAKGPALQRITDDAELFATHQLSPQDTARFEAAAQQWVTRSKDPATGEYYAAALPPRTREAFIRAGVPIPTGALETPTPDFSLSDKSPPPATTIFGDAHLVTGPSSSIQSTLGGTPVVGEFFRPDEIVTARTRVTSLKRELVRVMQNSPKFNEGERKAIDAEINIEPQFFDTKGDFRNRVSGIDDALAIRQDTALAIIQAPAGTVTASQKTQAIQEFGALQRFRLHLGAPPIMKSAKDARALPEGAWFRTPSGKILKNTEKAKEAEEEAKPDGRS